MEGLEHRARETVEQYYMPDPGGRVAVAVSGGVGFVCLLTSPCTFRGPWGVRFRVLHVHHGPGGEEADRDADFVRSLYEGLHAPYHALKVDVCGLAAEKGMSEEEVGCFLRYEALERKAADREDEGWTGPDGGSADSSVRPAKITVAYHSGGQVETILHDLFRGSGPPGTKGIVYRRSRIIRPLLDVDRDCIPKRLAGYGPSHVQDFTNDTLYYTRNRAYNQLLPEIEQYVNRGAAGNVLRLGHLAAWADEYPENQVVARIKTHVKKNSGAYTPAEALLGEPRILRFCVVMSLLKGLGGASRDLGLAHVNQVVEPVGRSAGKQADLPYGLVVIRGYEETRMGRGDSVVEEGWGDLLIVDTEVLFWKKGMKFPKNVYTKWFDRDKIKSMSVVRTRRPRNYIVLAGHNHKAFNRFMIDEEISRQIKDKIPLLADGNHVMWVIGYRMSEYYKIGLDMVRALRVETGQA